MSKRKTATIKWFYNDKGFGFTLEKAGEDVFVHQKEMLGDGFKTLADGQEISYTEVKTEKGWQAAEVLRLESETA